MAGVIQVGDVIKFSEIAWTVWNYGWASERNAGDNYRAFGTDVRTLLAGLKKLENAVAEAQTSLHDHGARRNDILGGDKTSLGEIIGDYEETLKECRKLLEKNHRYDQTTGPMRNIDWNINIMPQVEHLQRRIQMHNTRIQHVLRPFQIDLIRKIHEDLVRRLTSMHKDVLGIKRDFKTLLDKYYPEVAKEIEQQSKQELCSLDIPGSLVGRLEEMFGRRRLDQPRTLQELTDCFLIHMKRSTVQLPLGPENAGQYPSVACYVALLKCQVIMRRIKGSNELQNPPRISHWPGYIDFLEEASFFSCFSELSHQCSRFRTELKAPNASHCEDEMLIFWDEDERNVKKPRQTIGPPYDFLLEVPLVPEIDATTTWRMMRLSRKTGSDHHFRIRDSWGNIDQPSTEEPTVVDFNIHTATLVPIYADPVTREEGTLVPLEIILEDNDKNYKYCFRDLKDILLFQEAITGFKVVAGYTQPHTAAFFVRPGQEESFLENVTVQLWIPSSVKGYPDNGDTNHRRPSSGSQSSAPPTPYYQSRANSIASSLSTAAVSFKSWSSSGSDDTISLKVDGVAATAGYGVIRPCPRNPLLVLFTRSPDSSKPKRSIMAIKIDDETRTNPERCNCQKTRTCRIAALEQRHGRFHAQKLEHSAKWNLLPLVTAPDWGGLLRVSILFPTVEARERFSGSHCECKMATESDIDTCLSKLHQGLLGIVRVLYRRQMIMWQEQRHKQKEVDTYPPSGFSKY
ncbi:hypothetical protein QQS21_000390 [Conoideocrella luteorostrata]|uniref:Uncharacterized protein n=1 Tax=Conoideocrella luteorostrata TaxID=1105319 RepID=A0AAJ0G2I3_9HYPO|nr:hypothetical protein QQS21_000390 [Conoideocrella luteorostrata]